MIAFSDQDGHVTVAGTVKEWRLFIERLDLERLDRMDDANKAQEILSAASDVSFSGGRPMKRSN